jgi:UrcA family protein
MSRTNGFARTLLAAFLASTLAAPAFAADGEARSVRIGYADLDLTTPGGASALAQRIRAAARKVCGAAESRSAAGQVAWRECRETALDGAVANGGSRAPDVRRVVARVRASGQRS